MDEPRIYLTSGIGSDARIEMPDHTKGRDNVWLTIELPGGRPRAELNIVVTDEGLVLDLYGQQREDADEADMEPVASMYAFDADLDLT